MKLATVLALTAQAQIDGDRKIGNGDRKVPSRHPLQRLWRLYQFSEEIILLHYYRSPMKKSRVDAIRELIKKWLYMGQRESFLRGTKKCGFYDPDEGRHGGPAPLDENGNPNFDGNQASDLVLPAKKEFNGYKIRSQVADQVPNSIEIFRVRPENHPRIRRSEVSTFEFEQERLRRDLVAETVQKEIEAFKFQLDGDFDDELLEDDGGRGLLRLQRDNPCVAIKQVFVGFRKWADRYIANCDGQATHKHMHKRALKFYNEFVEVCADIPPIEVIAPSN